MCVSTKTHTFVFVILVFYPSKWNAVVGQTSSEEHRCFGENLK